MIKHKGRIENIDIYTDDSANLPISLSNKSENVLKEIKYGKVTIKDLQTPWKTEDTNKAIYYIKEGEENEK